MRRKIVDFIWLAMHQHAVKVAQVSERSLHRFPIGSYYFIPVDGHYIIARWVLIEDDLWAVYCLPIYGVEARP